MTRSYYRWLVGLGLLALAYVAYTQAVAAGALDGPDLGVDGVFTQLRETAGAGAEIGGRVVALLGGPELTVILAAGLAVELWRRRFRRESVGLLAFPLLLALEIVYKRLVPHPAPPKRMLDGPSLTDLLAQVEPHIVSNSYPSGHMARTVLVYGLLAFVVHRLAPPGLARSLAIPAAAVIIAAMALDRLFLGVHWQSDVLGGALLGGLLLAAAIAWIDRPVPVR